MITMTVIQLITGAIGSVAFGLLFHMKTKYLPLAAAGGFRKKIKMNPLIVQKWNTKLPAVFLAGWSFSLGRVCGEMFFFRHCWLVLLQMCMRKSWQESARKLPLLFSLLP